MVRLEFTGDGANKFWSIEIENEEETLVKFGPIGSWVRELHKSHSSAETAKTYMEKEIAKKKKKGYVEISSEGKSAEKSGGNPDNVEPAAKKPKGESSFTRLEFENGGYKTKFWWIKVEGCKTEVGYGSMYPKEGKPRISEKTHASHEQAEQFKAKMVVAKRSVGFDQVEPKITSTERAAVKLHLFGSEVSAYEVEIRNGDWEAPLEGGIFHPTRPEDQDLCRKDILHNTMNTAPPAAKEVADALRSAMPNIGSLPFFLDGFAGYSPEWAGGEIFVISSPLSDPKESCLEALAIQEKYVETMRKRACVRYGFKVWDDKSEKEVDSSWVSDDADEESKDEMTKGWKIFESNLKDVFKFAVSFPPRVKTCPVIFAGTCKDGSLVGVLGTRIDCGA